MLMIVCLGRRASPRTSTTALAALVIASFFFYKCTKTDAYQRSLTLITLKFTAVYKVKADYKL